MASEQSACVYCKKTNHPSEKCFFKKTDEDKKNTQTQQENACVYCKKRNHSSDDCRFKPLTDTNNTEKTNEPEITNFEDIKNNGLNKCIYCKKTNHSSDKCFFKDKKTSKEKNNAKLNLCQYCKKTNHTSENCRFKPLDNNSEVQEVQQDQTDEESKQEKDDKLTNQQVNELSIQPSQVTQCIYCKKNNHRSEKCYFNPANKRNDSGNKQ